MVKSKLLKLCINIAVGKINDIWVSKQRTSDHIPKFLCWFGKEYRYWFTKDIDRFRNVFLNVHVTKLAYNAWIIEVRDLEDKKFLSIQKY